MEMTNVRLGTAAEVAATIGDVPYRNKLVIFTSFYEQRGYAGYIHSLAVTAMVLDKLKVKWDYWPHSGDFHVENAINMAMTKFCNSDEYAPTDDFLMIDADESWNATGMMLLLLHDEEVVGGSYCMKNKWHIGTAKIKVDDRHIPVGKVTSLNRPLLEADRLPAGFLRIKKSALLKYRDHFKDRWYWDTDRIKKEKLKVTQFFLREIRDGELFSQDFNFSEDMKALGFKLWCEPDITIGHYGLDEHILNLDQHLRQVKKEQDAKEIVKNMAEEIKERSAA